MRDKDLFVKIGCFIASYLLGRVYHVSQLSHLLPVVFVQQQTQTWIKEADEKKRKKKKNMQDICKMKQKRLRPV